MKYSKNLNLALPSSDNNEDIADINPISHNFEIIDEVLGNFIDVVCNALKGSASGNPIRIDDVSPLEHEIAVRLTPYVNANGTKVTSYGENHLPYPYLNTTRTENGITFTDNGDGTVTANGIATGDVFFFCDNSFTSQVVGETYHLSGCPSGGGDKKYALDCYGGGVGYARDTGSGIAVTPKDNSKMSFRIVIYSGATVNNLVFKPMLALGATATEYEPFVAPTTYTADENGNVNVTSVYPTTTLIADNGVSISAEYNRDINKVIAGIIAKIGGI
jgi:hypothetical protein